MPKEVTKSMTLRERYVTRSGCLTPDFAEVNRIAEEKRPQHYKDEDKIGRVTLNSLENEINAIAERIRDRETSVKLLTPAVADAQLKLDRCKSDLALAQEAVAENITGARLSLKHAEIKLKWATDQHAAVRVRLEISEKILAAAQKLSTEWYVAWGATLQKMRRLTTGPKVGDKF
jgi:chromosome segregation ATPase